MSILNPYLLVGAGGALGAMLRYGLSLVSLRSSFPFMTFFTNVTGAVLIGFIVGTASRNTQMSQGLLLFLKTGLCGGYTTFSTFSLETLSLFEKKQYGTGCLYAGLSLAACIFGVWLGKILAGVGRGA